MNQPIIYIDTSKILDGKLEQLKASMIKLKTFVENKMPRLKSYAFYLNESETEMIVVAVHPDSASLEYHLNMGNEQFKKFSEFIELLKIEVYGKVNEAVLEKLYKKAEMLGKGTIEVNNLYKGFSR